jgi:outer membrane protein assembly factor BamB
MSTNPKPNDWFMYHGGYGHGGNAGSGSPLNSTNVNAAQFDLLHKIQVNGSILSVPAIVDGFIYVGLANSHDAQGSNGGSLQKYDIVTGNLICEYTWAIELIDRDTHGFTGMGCTPTVINGFVYFVGFDAKLYCLNQNDLSLVWMTDLRYADLSKNQPLTNTAGMEDGNPPAAGWSSPTVVNLMIDGVSTPRIFIGIGEGENPDLHSFIFCLDANTGIVVWILCTSQFVKGVNNAVNQLPEELVSIPVPPGYTTYNGITYVRGCSVWSAIAYDAGTGLLYASTGQPAWPASENKNDTGLPSDGYSSGIIALNAITGNFVAFTQMPAEMSYRKSDLDVDIGSACTLYTLPASATNPKPRRVVGVGCKNGGFMVCDANTLELINSVSLLPKMNDGTQIPTIDIHPPADMANPKGQHIPNDVSNANGGENYFGPFNTAAVDPNTGTLFIAIGGPNYHAPAPGIDSTTTPFMKAIKWDPTQWDQSKWGGNADAWPMDNNDPPRYKNVGASMYTNPGESGLSSPAVANDVVFVTTSAVAIYAFRISDGTLLWSMPIGNQTQGFNGGYGYSLGPAIWGSYVVAGALVAGYSGGLLNIYGLKTIPAV